MVVTQSHISSPRLELRLLSLKHAPLIMEARIESFAQLRKWGIWGLPHETSPDVINLADEIKMCERRLDRIKQSESIFYSIFRREDNRYLGNVSLTKCNWNERRAMIGFWLRTSETRKGYAAESAEVLLKHGINDLGLGVYSMHAAGNEKSQAVLIKLGFKKVRTDAACQKLPDGSMVDEIYYEL